MDTAKIYHDSEGNERTIGQMIKDEPYWAANRLQEGEKAIERVAELEAQLRFLVDNDSINDSSIEKEVESLLSK